MAEVVYKATKSIEAWLGRSGLTLDSLQALPANTAAQVGRQWQAYVSAVNKMQGNLGCSDTTLELYELQHQYSAPDLGTLDVAKSLGRNRAWEKPYQMGNSK